MESATVLATPEPYVVVHLRDGEQLRLQIPGIQERDESERFDYFNEVVSGFRQAGAALFLPTEDWTVARAVLVSWGWVSHIEVVW